MPLRIAVIFSDFLFIYIYIFFFAYKWHSGSIEAIHHLIQWIGFEAITAPSLNLGGISGSHLLPLTPPANKGIYTLGYDSSDQKRIFFKYADKVVAEVHRQ